MNAINTVIAPDTETHTCNRAEMETLVARLQRLHLRAVAQSDDRVDRFDQKGQLLPRRRLTTLLDPGRPFLDLYHLAGARVRPVANTGETQDPRVAGCTLHAGIGFISDVRCLIVADDMPGGTRSSETQTKLLRLFALCEKLRLPFVHLLDGGGLNLRNYSVTRWAESGQVLQAMARLSGAGIPSLGVLHGVALAEDALALGLCDHVIAVKRRGRASLASAAQLQAAHGESASDAELGSVEMHAQETGLVGMLANNDAEALAMARVQVSDWERFKSHDERPEFASPEKGADALLAMVPTDPEHRCSLEDLLLHIVDGGSLRAFKSDFARDTFCATAQITGRGVAVLGAQGSMGAEGIAKSIEFLERAEKDDLPVLFLTQGADLDIGRAAASAGVLRLSASLLRKVVSLRVPKIALQLGGSYGVLSHALCGPGGAGEFRFSWPSACSGIMPGQIAARTFKEIANRAAKLRGMYVDEDRLARETWLMASQIDRQGDAFTATSKGLDMGVIDPTDSRRVLGFCLDTCMEAAARQTP